VVKYALRAGTFPLVLAGAVGCTWFGLTAGAAPSLLVLLVILFSALPLLALQAVIPHERDWAGTPRALSVDILHMLSTGFTTDLWRALSFAALYKVAAVIAGLAGGTLWPSSAPMLAQLGLALVLGDLGAYFVHRSAHRLPLVWRVHAMHHSSERLHALSAGRNHPGNVLLTFSSQVLPCILLGAGAEILALLAVFTAVHGMLQHANIAFLHGPLNWVFATADLHRFHYSQDFAESNTNFGSNLALWDVVFSTRYLPNVDGPEAVGLAGMEMPENFLHHLVSPLVLERYETDEVPKPEVVGITRPKGLRAHP
jgi:sterol desaturase/sphingolipid hydroxylase (fatty acid hydroxylase superfamily)